MPADLTPVARTIPDTIEVSGLGRTKLYELINRGELPVVVVDGRTLILDQDLRECLARRRQYRGAGKNGADLAPTLPPEPSAPSPAPHRRTSARRR